MRIVITDIVPMPGNMAMEKAVMPPREIGIELCLRAKIRQHAAQGGWCWLCGELMVFGLPQNSYGFITWEHIVARSRGGTWQPENLMLTHWECNWVRGNQTYEKHPRPAPDEIKRAKEVLVSGINANPASRSRAA